MSYLAGLVAELRYLEANPSLHLPYTWVALQDAIRNRLSLWSDA